MVRKRYAASSARGSSSAATFKRQPCSDARGRLQDCAHFRRFSRVFSLVFFAPLQLLVVGLLMPRPSSAAVTTAPRRQRRTNEQRRNESDKRLLDAGLRLVAKKGAAGATLADIGLAAGFSRSLPLERFGSKQQFLVALVDRTEQWFNQWAFADLQGKEGLEGLTARIEAHLASAAASWDATSALFLLYFESLTVVPELRSRVTAVGHAYRTALSDLIRQGQALGEIRADVDPDVEATVLFGAIRGTIAQWLFEPKFIDLKKVARSLAENTRRSLSVDNHTPHINGRIKSSRIRRG
jgi:AcrR family transcriptional regulator